MERLAIGLDCFWKSGLAAPGEDNARENVLDGLSLEKPADQKHADLCQ